MILPSVAVQQEQELLATAARHAEAVGLDSVWHRDHVPVGRPVRDAGIALELLPQLWVGAPVRLIASRADPR